MHKGPKKVYMGEECNREIKGQSEMWVRNPLERNPFWVCRGNYHSGVWKGPRGAALCSAARRSIAWR